MKQKTTALIKSPITAYIVLYLALLALHIFMTNTTADDSYFCTFLNSGTLWEHTVKFYTGWSARTLVEAVTLTVGSLPFIIWQLVNPLIITFCAWALVQLAACHKSAGAAWLSTLLFIMYTWADMASAGWVTTFLVYLWPLAAYLASLLLIVRFHHTRKHTALYTIAVLLLSLYACNMEQLNTLVLVICIALLIRQLYLRERQYMLVCVQLLCSVANFVYAFTCPGTAARFANVIVTYHKDFAMQPFFAKLEQGFTETMRAAVLSPNGVAVIFCLCLAVCVCYRNKSAIYRTVSALPLLATVTFGMFGTALCTIIPRLSSLLDFAPIAVQNSYSFTAYLPFLLLCVIFSMWCCLVYLAFGHRGAAISGLVVLIAGIASRAALGLTPSLYASGGRTQFYFMCALILLSLLLYRQFNKMRAKYRVAFWSFAALVCIYQYFTSFVYVLSLR